MSCLHSWQYSSSLGRRERERRGVRSEGRRETETVIKREWSREKEECVREGEKRETFEIYKILLGTVNIKGKIL